MPVGELGRRMSCAELMRWSVFFEIETVDIPEQLAREREQRALSNKILSAFSKLGGL